MILYIATTNSGVCVNSELFSQVGTFWLITRQPKILCQFILMKMMEMLLRLQEFLAIFTNQTWPKLGKICNDIELFHLRPFRMEGHPSPGYITIHKKFAGYGAQSPRHYFFKEAISFINISPSLLASNEQAQLSELFWLWDPKAYQESFHRIYSVQYTIRHH